MKKNYLKSRFLVVLTIVSILIVSMFASEKASLTNVFMNEEELSVNIVEYKGTFTLPVIDFVSKIDPGQAYFQYEGNKSKAVITVGDTVYRFFRYRPYYYVGSKRVLYSVESMDDILVPSNFRAYGVGDEIYVPFNVLLNVLDIQFTYDTGVVAFDFNKSDVVVDSGLTEQGRQVFNPKEDDISTQVGIKAFEEKYGLGEYVTSDRIPTKYDLNPDFYADKGSNSLWSADIYDLYQGNPPELIGLDGSKAPYEATSDVFFKWLSDNDPYLSFDKKEASGKFGGDTPSEYDLERGTYFYGLLDLYTSKIDDLFIYDGELDPYVKYDEDVTIFVGKWSPVNNVYVKMVLRHYLGADEGLKAYQMVDMGFTEGGVDLNKGYQFGDREVYLTKVAGGVNIVIGEPGFKVYGIINDVDGYYFSPGKMYNNPFDSTYIPY